MVLKPLRVPKILRHDTAEIVLPKEGKINLDRVHLRLPRILRKQTSDVVLPKEETGNPDRVHKLNLPSTLKARRKIKAALPKKVRTMKRKLKAMTSEQVDKPVVQEQRVSAYQQELIALWKSPT